MKARTITYFSDPGGGAFVTVTLVDGETLVFRMESQRLLAAGVPLARVAEELSTHRLVEREITTKWGATVTGFWVDDPEIVRIVEQARLECVNDHWRIRTVEL